MKRGTIWGIAIVVVVIGAIFFMNSNNPGPVDFAQCITESGAKMYGAYWCPHCLNQKKAFGDAWEHIDYIECSLPNNGGQTQICAQQGIESYPTWEFKDGERLTGELPFETLAQKTGCTLS